MDPKVLKAELKAMGRLPAILGTLPHASQKRVIAWLTWIYWGEPELLTEEDIIKTSRPQEISGPAKKSDIEPVYRSVPQPKASYRSKRVASKRLKL